MHVAFRVDAGEAIGIGHFMRCMTLADEIHRRGARVTILSRDLPEHLVKMAAVSGFAVEQLAGGQEFRANDQSPERAWTSDEQHRDAEDVRARLASNHTDWLCVDHYGLDRRWEAALGNIVRRRLVIDDLANRPHECDVLLDQNLYPDLSDRYDCQVSSVCRQVLGPRYALLRPAFSRLRSEAGPRTGQVKRIMVLFGGTDAANHTAKSLRALAQLGPDRWKVDVIIGRQHPDPVGVAALCEVHGYDLHVQVNDVASMMLAADLAIGASGSTSWERCALGLPTVCVTQQDNQVAIAQGLASAGAVLDLGNGDMMSDTDFAVALSALIDDPDRLRQMSNAAWGLVDGLGVTRVADILEELR